MLLDPVVAFAAHMLGREKRVGAEDVYKFLFHATQGGEHAISDPAGPKAWMRREWRSLGKPRKSERLFTPLVRDGHLVRINLRPARAQGWTKAEILDAFILSAKRFRPDKARFKSVWAQAIEVPRAFGLTKEAMLALDAKARPLGYPAWDHSPAYERTNAPAYRVVLVSCLKRRTARPPRR